MDGLPSLVVFDDPVSLPFGRGISVAFEADVSTRDEDMVEVSSTRMLQRINKMVYLKLEARQVKSRQVRSENLSNWADRHSAVDTDEHVHRKEGTSKLV